MRKILLRIVLCSAVLCILAVSVQRFRFYIVMSGSMEPGIPTGSLIITDTIKKTPASGDVITYHAGENRITHRVVRVQDNGTVITKGDHNASEDPVPVAMNDIEGTVLFSLPKLGMLILFLRQPSAFCLLVLLVIIITVLIQSKERSQK